MFDESERFTILVVDDDPSIRMLLPSHLIGRGFNVLKAADGQEGVAMATESQPDLILLDINMPTMTGIEACEALKRDPRTRDIPIVFMTSLGNDADRLAGFAAGGDDYVIKPINHAEVTARIRRYVTQKVDKGRQRQLCEVLTRCREGVDGVMAELAPGTVRDTLTTVLEELQNAQAALDGDVLSPATATEAPSV